MNTCDRQFPDYVALFIQGESLLDIYNDYNQMEDCQEKTDALEWLSKMERVTPADISGDFEWK